MKEECTGKCPECDCEKNCCGDCEECGKPDPRLGIPLFDEVSGNV
jgi:hypothetical protein